MVNQLICIFTIYYIIFIIHVLQHIYFYELFFSIYYPKSVSYFVRYNYATITILELVTHFNSKTIRSSISSHITKLMNYKNLHEVFQHERTAKKIGKDYYHISDEYQGYDSFSFNKDNLQKIVTEKDISLMTLYEKKALFGNVSKYNKIPYFVEMYSHPNIEGLENNKGARPGSVDELEFGTLLPQDYNILQTILKNSDLSEFKELSVIIEDYSDVYVKVVFNPKKGCLGDGTIISDSAFENLKWFYDFLENNEKMCLYMNDLLEENRLFPLTN